MRHKVTQLAAHAVNLRLGGTPHVLSLEVVYPKWDDGCLEYIGSRVVHNQGLSLRANVCTVYLSVLGPPARKKSDGHVHTKSIHFTYHHMYCAYVHSISRYVFYWIVTLLLWYLPSCLFEGVLPTRLNTK